MTFEEAYVQYHQDVRRLSRKQVLPGMEPEDVESEMLIVLWKAVDTFDPSLGSLWGRFWGMWTNRRKNILKSYYAVSRPATVYTDVLPVQPVYDTHRADLGSLTGQQRQVWDLLAEGSPAKEVKEVLGLSQRAYYAVVHDLRTPEIRAFLY